MPAAPRRRERRCERCGTKLREANRSIVCAPCKLMLWDRIFQSQRFMATRRDDSSFRRAIADELREKGLA